MTAALLGTKSPLMTCITLVTAESEALETLSSQTISVSFKLLFAGPIATLDVSGKSIGNRNYQEVEKDMIN